MEHGGEDEVVKAEKSMLEEYGHEVFLFECANSEIKNFDLFHKIRLSLCDIYWSKTTYQSVKKIIQDKKPDIVHIHNTFLLISPSVYDACFEAQVPVVQTLHNYRFLCPAGTFYRKGYICEKCLPNKRIFCFLHRCWRSSFFLSCLLWRIVEVFYKKKIFSEHIKSYIALSNFSREMFIENGFPADRVFVKPNFLDVDPGYLESSEEYGLFVGALRDYKGIKTLVKAWNSLETQHTLKIIGDGPLRGYIEKPSNNSIELLGSKTLRETMDYMKKARFVIVPSECYETFSRVSMESLACGVPVIASDIGALREMVEHEYTGLLFRAGDSNDLAEKINRLFSDKDLVKELKRNARNRYKERYTLAANYKMLMDVYNATMDVL